MALGCSGAITLVVTSATAESDKVGNIRGDLLVLGAQLSYALFLSLFSKLVRKYSTITVNKWMFLWATILIWPFSYGHVYDIKWSEIPSTAILGTLYVVVFGTYVGYILIVKAQQILRPTVVSVYNYVQPIVSVSVSILLGIGVFKPAQGLAVALVFLGVWLVNKSKSRKDMEKKH